MPVSIFVFVAQGYHPQVECLSLAEGLWDARAVVLHNDNAVGRSKNGLVAAFNLTWLCRYLKIRNIFTHEQVVS